MEIIPRNKPNQKTIFTYDKITFDIPMKESFYSLQNLKKLKVWNDLEIGISEYMAK